LTAKERIFISKNKGREKWEKIRLVTKLNIDKN
jgi:hypothetical protein